MPPTADLAISAEHLSKQYRLYERPIDRLKEALSRGKRTFHTPIWAVRDVSFDVPRGSTLGIIGRNGSGKSTLLQIIAGVLRPTYGQARIAGRVAALLELGTGFNHDFTGKENVYLNGAILGLSTEQIDERFPEIEAFAEIGDAVNHPVKTYSSGMVVRLAFSVLVHLDPDILIVDEALAVGDVYFQHKCIQFLKGFTEQGGTLLFVSHAMDMIITLADHAILLDGGEVKSAGRPDEVSRDYARLITQLHSEGQSRRTATRADGAQRSRAEFQVDSDVRYGTRQSRIVSIELLDARAEPTRVFEVGAEVRLRVVVRYEENVPLPAWGLDIKLPNDLSVFVNTSMTVGHQPGPGRAGQTVALDHRLTLNLAPATYIVALGIGELHDGRYVRHDRLHHAIDFEVIPPPGRSVGSGIAHLNHRVDEPPA